MYLLLSPVPLHGQGWIIEDVAPWGRFCDSAVDASGVTHVVYTNCWWHGLCEEGDPNPPRIWYGHKADGPWTLEELSSQDAFGIPSLALDSNGRPHVAFQYQAWHDFKYFFHDGTAWVKETIVPANPLAVKKEISLALDANDVPHIAFYERERIRYGNRSSGTWFDEDVTDSYLEENWSLTPLVIDASGNPHIGTKGYTWVGSVHHYKREGTWFTETVAPDDGGDMTVMVQDADGNLHMSWHRGGLYPTVRYATNAGGQWTVETVMDTALHFIGDIATDHSGRPYVAYEKVQGMYWDPIGLHVAWKTADGWTERLVDPDGEHASLSIDSDDKLHVMYFNRSTNTLRHAELVEAVSVKKKSWGAIKTIYLEPDDQH